MIRWVLCGLVLLILMVPVAGEAVEKVVSPGVMFILDASGSMWGGAGGETKIDAARDVLAQLVPTLPPEVQVGLTAYGHRTKGDCADVEILVPIGSKDRGAVLSRILSITPKGMTPIADSITMVAQQLKSSETDTTIVLISDGEETCNADPCGVVKALKEAGIRFVLHVVGFGVNEKQKSQLECLANAGGGEYYGAEDADTLFGALDSVTVEVVEMVEKAKTLPKKAATGLGKLQITMPAEATVSLNAFIITRIADGKIVKTVENPSSDSTHPLPAGEYSLVVSFANPNYQPPTDISWGTFTINGGEVTRWDLGALAFNMADSLADLPVQSVTIANQKPGGFSLTLQHHGNGYYLFKPKPLPPGNYAVSVTYARCEVPTPLAESLAVAVNRTVFATIDCGFKIMQPASGSGDVTGWELRVHGTETPVIAVTRRWDNQYPLWETFAVMPGQYDLFLTLKGMDEPLPVAAGLAIQKGDLQQFESGL